MPDAAAKLNQRLSARLQESARFSSDIDELLNGAVSEARFDSKSEFREYLAEGAVLSVGKIGSRCLSVPCGDYIVWATPARNTILVPTSAVEPGGDLLTTEAPKQFEISTSRVLGAWDKVQKGIQERADGGRFDAKDADHDGAEGGHFDAAPDFQPDEPYTFGAKVGRTSLWQAMQRAGLGVSELADQVGVDKSTISRYLRDVKDGPGDPHGRNPSVALAQKIAKVLGTDVDEVLPPPEDLATPDRGKTSGSGRGGAGKHGRRGNQNYAKGGGAPPHESVTIGSVAKLMAECRVDPVQFISESIVADDRMLNEFLGSLGSLLGRKQSQSTNYDQTFDTAIQALKKLSTTFAGVQGSGGYSLRDQSGNKTTLDKWLNQQSVHLQQIKAKMPEVMARKQKAAGEKAQEASKAKAQQRIDGEVKRAEQAFNDREKTRDSQRQRMGADPRVGKKVGMTPNYEKPGGGVGQWPLSGSSEYYEPSEGEMED